MDADRLGLRVRTGGDQYTTCLLYTSILRASDKLDQGYTFQIEPDRQRVVYKAYPFPNEHGGKILPYEVELERPFTLSPNRQHAFKLVIEDSICELYLDDQVAMSARMYDLQDGQLVFFAVDGEVTFENIRVKSREDPR